MIDYEYEMKETYINESFIVSELKAIYVNIIELLDCSDWIAVSAKTIMGLASSNTLLVPAGGLRHEVETQKSKMRLHRPFFLLA